MKVGFDVEAKELPLLQNCFIEASAGTGKSYTIKTVVIRLLIEKELPLDQILVVTFTRFATIELKEAIRKAIKMTLLQLQRGEDLPSYLMPYVGQKRVERLLKGALASIENAKIMTIHGFAAYLLSQYQNKVIVEEKIASPEQLFLLIKDFFRTELSVEEVSLWQQELLLNFYQGDFERLVKEIAHIAVKRIPIQSDIPSQELLEKQRVRFRGESIFEELSARALHTKGMCNRKREVKEEVLEEFRRVAAWIEGEEVELRFKELFKLLPENPYAELLQLLQQMNDPLMIFALIAEKARLYLIKVLEKEPLFFYDDLLLQAATLIEKKEVQEAIREEFRAAFIDEFQDTDELQWKIFSTLFLSQGSLVVVGDPKQSIYRFRHADLYTYMKAKESFTHHLALSTNYRSSPRLVEALNQLCQSVDEFLILPERGESFPCPRVEPKACEGEDLSHFEFWKVESEEQLFHCVAAELAYLQKERGIALSECAILVKDRYQMERFKEAMQPFSLPLQIGKERAITDAPAYPLLLDLLESLREPNDLSKNAKVLLSPLFSFSLDEIEGAQLALLPDFFAWRELLENKGLFVAIEAVMARCAPSLLRNKGGVSNYRDLMQLVALGEENALSAREYLTFYRKLPERQELLEGSKNAIVLEEEAPLIMTIHMSKGLEFRVVFPIGMIAPYSRHRQLIYSSTSKKYLVGEDEAEIEAEKMRLFYVAITRAKERLYIPYIEGNEKKKEGRSSLIELFMSKSHLPLDARATRSFIEQKISSPSFVKQENPLLRPQLFSWPIHSHQPIQSFSSLYPHTLFEKELSPPSFPTGASVGILLHQVLEKISFRHRNPTHLKTVLVPLLKNTILEEHIEEISSLLFQMMHFPLKGGFTLSDLDEKKMRKEVNFLMSDDKGGMKGVIDLFFSHQGYYYFLDWKSNQLENYGEKAIAEEMEAFHYLEQAAIYKAAIAKYIALFDSRPFEESFGGYYYLFIRGPAFYYGR